LAKYDYKARRYDYKQKHNDFFFVKLLYSVYC